MNNTFLWREYINLLVLRNKILEAIATANLTESLIL